MNSNWKIRLTSCCPLVNLSRANVHIGGCIGCMDDDLVDLSHASSSPSRCNTGLITYSLSCPWWIVIQETIQDVTFALWQSVEW